MKKFRFNSNFCLHLRICKQPYSPLKRNHHFFALTPGILHTCAPAPPLPDQCACRFGADSACGPGCGGGGLACGGLMGCVFRDGMWECGGETPLTACASASDGVCSHTGVGVFVDPQRPKHPVQRPVFGRGGVDSSGWAYKRINASGGRDPLQLRNATGGPCPYPADAGLTRFQFDALPECPLGSQGDD